MPPTFKNESFLFADGEEIPDHNDAFPNTMIRDMAKWMLEGEDGFGGLHYALAVDIDSDLDALQLAAARLRHLEVVSPTMDSGGQMVGGIQDRVYITQPFSITPERYNPPRSELFGNSPERPQD